MADSQVRMLTAMAGEVISFAHGEIVTVEKTIADAWIKAGIAEVPPAAAASEKKAKDATARVAELEQQLAEAMADRDAVKAQAEQLGAQVAELTAKLAAVPAPAQPAPQA